jgi:hypothetical protein
VVAQNPTQVEHTNIFNYNDLVAQSALNDDAHVNKTAELAVENNNVA